MKAVNAIVACAIASLMSLTSQAAQPPSQSVIDQYISVAQRVNPQALEGKGRYTCKDAVGMHPGLSASDNDFQKAQTKYFLKCLRVECENLDRRISEQMVENSTLSDQELTDFMYSMEIPQDKINAALAARKLAPGGVVPGRAKVTCENATPLARQFVGDSCFALPIQCTQ